jgi:hypothetical protein
VELGMAKEKEREKSERKRESKKKGNLIHKETQLGLVYLHQQRSQQSDTRTRTKRHVQYSFLLTFRITLTTDHDTMCDNDMIYCCCIKKKRDKTVLSYCIEGE